MDRVTRWDYTAKIATGITIATMVTSLFVRGEPNFLMGVLTIGPIVVIYAVFTRDRILAERDELMRILRQKHC